MAVHGPSRLPEKPEAGANECEPTPSYILDKRARRNGLLFRHRPY